MNGFLIFSLIAAAALTISDLFVTIRECNKNKYEYLKNQDNNYFLKNNIKGE